MMYQGSIYQGWFLVVWKTNLMLMVACLARQAWYSGLGKRGGGGGVGSCGWTSGGYTFPISSVSEDIRAMRTFLKNPI